MICEEGYIPWYRQGMYFIFDFFPFNWDISAIFATYIMWDYSNLRNAIFQSLPSPLRMRRLIGASGSFRIIEGPVIQNCLLAFGKFLKNATLNCIKCQING